MNLIQKEYFYYELKIIYFLCLNSNKIQKYFKEKFTCETILALKVKLVGPDYESTCFSNRCNVAFHSHDVLSDFGRQKRSIYVYKQL